MNPKSLRTRVATFLFLLNSLSLVTGAVLEHRYSFDSDANDSIGAAHGALQGAAVLMDGSLILSGTNASVLLPANLLSNYPSASIEIWFADQPVNGTNAQLFSFNSPQAQLSYALGGESVFRAGSTSGVVSIRFPPVTGTNHIVWTCDQAEGTVKLFANGRLAAWRTNVTFFPALMGSTPTIRIGGGSTTNAPTNFRGRILEFRIFEGALSEMEAATLHAAGPDEVVTAPGTLESVRLELPAAAGPGALIPVAVHADFSGTTNIDVTTQAGLDLSSSDTNLVQIENAKLRTLGPGTAEITAWYGGLSNTMILTVAPPLDAQMIHRYGFSELTNDWILRDAIGEAHGRVYPFGVTSPPTTAFTGKGELKVDGGGHAALPPGTLSKLSEVTFVVWVTWVQKSSSFWPFERIFDFGSSQNGWGHTYFYLTPNASNPTGVTAAVTTNSLPEPTRMDYATNISLNATSFFAVVYSPSQGAAHLYINGTKMKSHRTWVPLGGILDTNNWLGRSQFSQDSAFAGRYDEFRIYSGALSEAEVQSEFVLGPNAIGSDFALRHRVTPEGLRLSWGSSATGWQLESTDSLGDGSSWAAVETEPEFQEGRYSLVVPISIEGSRFYRLKGPSP